MQVFLNLTQLCLGRLELSNQRAFRTTLMKFLMNLRRLNSVWSMTVAYAVQSCHTRLMAGRITDCGSPSRPLILGSVEIMEWFFVHQNTSLFFCEMKMSRIVHLLDLMEFEEYCQAILLKKNAAKRYVLVGGEHVNGILNGACF